MKKILSIVELILLVVFVYSCKTDVDLNADYKEITVVYGLLDPSDTVQYVKINKAFLGEGDALLMAANPDSINYGPNEISVSLREYTEAGTLIRTFPLIRTENEIIKEPGIFGNATNVLYKTTEPILQDKEYELVVINKSGEEVTARTEMVYQSSITKPNSVQKISFANNSGSYFDYTFKFTTGKNVKRAEMYFTFNYTEVSTTDTIEKSEEFYVGQIVTSSLKGGEALELDYNGENFYKELKNRIPVNNNVQRWIGNVDIKLVTVSNELNAYIEVNSPSTSIVQSKPEYSNINNGTGIFASRRREYKIGADLSLDSKKELYGGIHTAALNFCIHYVGAPGPYSCN